MMKKMMKKSVKKTVVDKDYDGMKKGGKVKKKAKGGVMCKKGGGLINKNSPF